MENKDIDEAISRLGDDIIEKNKEHLSEVVFVGIITVDFLSQPTQSLY